MQNHEIGKGKISGNRLTSTGADIKHIDVNDDVDDAKGLIPELTGVGTPELIPSARSSACS